METSTETPELETSAIHPPGGDTALTLLDIHVSNASLPVGKTRLLSFTLRYTLDVLLLPYLFIDLITCYFSEERTRGTWEKYI